MVVSRVWVCPRGGAGPVLSVIFEGGSASGRERINNRGYYPHWPLRPFASLRIMSELFLVFYDRVPPAPPGLLGCWAGL